MLGTLLPPTCWALSSRPLCVANVSHHSQKQSLISNDLVPGRNPSLEIALLAILISGVAYGLVIALYISCVCVLRPKAQHRARTRLICYSTILCLTSTWAFVQGSYSIMAAIFKNAADTSGPTSRFSDWLLLTESNPWFLPVALWTADGIMVWRCIVLYQGMTRRWMRILLYFALTILCLMALVAGFCILIPLNIMGLGPLVSISVSGGINVALSSLIVFRLNRHQKSFPKNSRAWRICERIIEMCVESCALIVLCSMAYIGLFFVPQPNGNEIPFFLLPHICAISPMLIIYRVAHRKEGDEERLSTIGFASTNPYYQRNLILTIPSSNCSSAASSPTRTLCSETDSKV